MKNTPSLRNVLDAKTEKVTASQLAIDCQVEESKVSPMFGKLQTDSDRPNFTQLERKFLPDKTSLIPGMCRLASARVQIHETSFVEETHFGLVKGFTFPFFCISSSSRAAA
jgi:hypothetical protein